MAVRFTRIFGIYTFFSVFLPGAALLVGLFPLFPHLQSIYAELIVPSTIEFGSFLSAFPRGGALIVFVIVSLLVGFVANMLAAVLEELIGYWEFELPVGKYDDTMSASIGRPPHEMFARTLQRNDNYVERELVEQFVETANKVFPELDLLDDEPELAEQSPSTDGGSVRLKVSSEEAKSLYTLVSGQVHMDATGRSRTFQAVSASCRSMTVVVPIFTGAYVLFALSAVSLPDFSVESLFEASAGGAPVFSVFVSVVLVGFLVTLGFARLAHRMKYIYIEYLIGDFVLLRTAESKIESDDEPLPQPTERADSSLEREDLATN